MPWRVVLGQGGGAGGFGLNIYAPDGEVVQTSRVMTSSGVMAGSPYFVSFACSGTVAPPSSPFGNES